MEHGYCSRIVAGRGCEHGAEVMVTETLVGVGQEGGNVERVTFMCALHSELSAVEAPGLDRRVKRLV